MADTSAPYITSNFPEHNARDLPVNTLVTVTFNELIDPTTITTETLTVINTGTYESVDGTVAWTPINRIATFTPSENLASGATYRTVVVGLTDPYATVPVGVRDVAGNYMVGNFSFIFHTDVGGGVSSDPDEAAVPSGITGYENPTLPSPSGQTLEGVLQVLDTEPSDYDTQVPISQQIVIEFNDDLGYVGTNVMGNSTMGVAVFAEPSSVLHNWITIENAQVLGTTAAAQNPIQWDGSFDRVNNKLTISPAADSAAANATGSHWYNKGTYTRGDTVYGVLEESNEYVVTIKAGLPGLTTNPLAEDYCFMFTTVFDPMFTSAAIIKLNLGGLLDDIPDDTINRLIMENGIYALVLYGTAGLTTTQTGLPWYIPKYVECKTKLDALNAKFLGMGSIGSRKVLADLTIDRDGAGRDLVALAQNKIDELQVCVTTMEGLIVSGGEFAQLDWAEPFLLDTRGPIRDQTWRRLPKMIERGAKPRPGLSRMPAFGRAKNRGFQRRRGIL